VKFALLLLLSLCSVTLRAQDGPNSTTAAATPVDVAPGIADMQKIEDRWSDAVTKRDQYGLELVLAPQLVDISATGDVTNRNQQIVALFKKDSPIVSLEQKVVSVRYLADGAVAIVNGTYVVRTKADGTKKDDKGIFTHVFTHVRTTWLCISSQRTQVAEQLITKPKAPAPKSGDLPFKIPLIHDPKTAKQ
jgi:ketosteroid isomerase-like protein